MIWLADLEDRDPSQPEGNKGAADARRCSCYLEEHEVELTRSEDLLERDAVGILLHALLLGKGEELPGHQTQQVKLLHVGLEVDADAVSVENRARLTKRSNRQSFLSRSGRRAAYSNRMLAHCSCVYHSGRFIFTLKRSPRKFSTLVRVMQPSSVTRRSISVTHFL